MALQFPRVHLRQEQKAFEHRSFSPKVIGALVEAGYQVTVERSSLDGSYKRIFEDSEYQGVGAELVDTGSWPAVAPGAVILGLKDLPRENFALSNDHVMFGHCYKGQDGWQEVLGRFPRGGSVLYDIEFLLDEHGRRVSAFGYFAGFAGAALGVHAWAWQLTHPDEPMPSIRTHNGGRGYYRSEDELVAAVKLALADAENLTRRRPNALVMGALGRVGRGASDLLKRVGLKDEDITRWDINETKDRHGPYEEIIKHDIFVNCVSLFIFPAGSSNTPRSSSRTRSRRSSTMTCSPKLAASSVSLRIFPAIRPIPTVSAMLAWNQKPF